MTVQVDGINLYASCHMDMKPMCLIHTTVTSNKGKPRYRRWAKFDVSVGHVIRETYTLQHPDVHAKYRAGFSAVDRFNKLALGTVSSV